MTDDANKKMAEDKKTLEKQNEQRAKAAEERAKHAGKPTPTQMENDLAAMGNHPELEPDGSPPDPNHPSPTAKKDAQAEHGGSYQTRQQTAGAEHQRNKPAAAEK
jgi:hypothetical protein